MTQTRKIVYRTPEQVYTKWLAALRSGKYKQIQEQLRGETDSGATGFCCLGVLCDLAVKDGGGTGKGWVKNSIEFSDKDGDINFHSGIPPEPMTDYLGITEEETQELMGMNDDHNRSFKYIARHIECSIMPKALARLKKQK